MLKRLYCNLYDFIPFFIYIYNLINIFLYRNVTLFICMMNEFDLFISNVTTISISIDHYFLLIHKFLIYSQNFVTKIFVMEIFA